MRIIPSVMARNQQELNTLLKKLEEVSTKVHLDVVDGKFAPSKSLWFPFRLRSEFRYSAHLMVREPEKWIARFGDRVDLCVAQFEAIKNVPLYIDLMKRKGKKVAVALQPSTAVSLVKPYVHLLDYALVLTVKPGFYGSLYLPQELRKIRLLKKWNPRLKVFVDGHMNPQTIGKALIAGADYCIAGSYVTLADDPKKAMRELRKASRR